VAVKFGEGGGHGVSQRMKPLSLVREGGSRSQNAMAGD
jgi:hypothetical protein